MEYDSYRKGIIPYIDWFMSEISKSKNGFIIIKISDLRIVMGDNFKTSSDNSIYTMLREILLENGIKIYGRTHNDGSSMLQMEIAKLEEIRTTAEVRRERVLNTAKKQGFETTAQYNRSIIWSGSTIRGKVLPESENTECPRYFGEYIEREYVSKIFVNPIPISYSPGWHEGKPYDYECQNGFKIKHVAACTSVSIYKISNYTNDPIPYYVFNIRRNNVPDYWVLTAWDNRESLEPKYVWIIKGNETFRTQYSYREGDKPFWDRASWTVYATRKGIDRMSKYEAAGRLEQLKDICNIARNHSNTTGYSAKVDSHMLSKEE